MAVVPARPGGTLVGRRSEWATALAALEATPRGAAWLAVEGEPGIGNP